MSNLQNKQDLKYYDFNGILRH